MAVLKFIQQALGGFIKNDGVIEALSLALISGRNLILWGPGGHGKSEMVTTALNAIAGARVMVQMFGEGMDESRLYGGINLKRLNDPQNPAVEYYAQRSFLDADFAVFEELFDAPTTVLLSLKDTLTAKKLRNGAQQHPMQTKVIIACTNRDPGEVSAQSLAAAALVERFPLQLQVAWDSYQEADFLTMFETADTTPPMSANQRVGLDWLARLQGKAQTVLVPEEVHKTLALVIERAWNQGINLSPRSAMYARDLTKAAAFIDGRTEATHTDIQAIKYLPGCEQLAQQVMETIEKARVHAEAMRQIHDHRLRFVAVKEAISRALTTTLPSTPITLLRYAKQLSELSERAGVIVVPDGLYEQRKVLVEESKAFGEETKKKALELVS